MQKLAQLLDIEPSEQKPVFLLLIHSFFTGIFLSYLFSVANGAFLKTFPPTYLPAAYIVSGLLGFGMSSVFSYLQQRIAYKILLPGVLLTLLGLMLFFTISLSASDNKWIAFVIFVGLAPIYTMVALQFWSMAMKMFDLRQGKRLFGLLGTGDVLSSLLGFASVPVILKAFEGKGGEITLLILGVIGLGLGLFFQLIIFKSFPEQLGGAKKAAGKGKQAKAPSAGLKSFLKNPYFFLIFMITFCSVLAQYFVDFNFMSLARDSFDKSERTAFIGSFFAVIKLVEFLAKTFAAGRLLKQYGLLFGLTLLPGLMISFGVLSALIDAWGLDVSYLFIPIAMNKLFDRSLRKAIDDPSMKLLYQPLPSETKLMVQTQAEGKAKQLGIITAGIILVIFGLLPSFDLLYVTLTLIAVVVAWLYYVRKVYQSYRDTIKARLLEEAESDPAEVPLSIYWLQRRLASAEGEEVLVNLKLAEYIEPYSNQKHWGRFLAQPNAKVRELARRLIKENITLEAKPQIQDRLQKASDPKEREELESLLLDFEQLERISPSILIALARSNSKEERRLAAQWLGYFEHPQRLLLLRELATDREWTVAVAAIHASASVKSVELWALMIDSLAQMSLSNASVPALIAEGESLLPMLDRAFTHMGEKKLALLKIIQIVGRLEGQRADAFLFDKLNYPNPEVKKLAATMLVARKYRVEESSDRALLRQQIANICEHYAWQLGCYFDFKQKEGFEYLISVLKNNMEETQSDLFLRLSMLYESDAIQKVEEYLSTGSKERLSLALEMIDMLLEEEIKPMVAAWLGNIGRLNRYVALNPIFPQRRYEQVEQRLQDILYKDFGKVNRWLRASALRKLMERRNALLLPEIEALACHQDFFIKETALMAIHRINPSRYEEYMQKEKKRDRIKYDRVTGNRPGLKRIPSNYDEVLLMRKNPFLESLPEDLLVKLSELAEQEAIDIGKQPSDRYKAGDFVHFVIEGKATLMLEDGRVSTWREGSVAGFLDSEPLQNSQFEVFNPIKIFYMDRKGFYALAQVHLPLLKAVYAYLLQGMHGQSAEEAMESNEALDSSVWETSAP